MQNFNGSGIYHDFLSAVRRNPAELAERQADLNAKRLNRALRARSTRPVVLPLRFAFTAAGRVSPFTQQTDKQEWPLDLLGANHNFPGIVNDVNMRRTGSERNFASLDPLLQIQPKVHDFAHHGESQGVFYWPAPVPLEKNQQLAADAYKPINTGVAEARYLNLVGQRVYKQSAAEASFEPDELAEVREVIAARRIPEWRVLVMNVVWRAGGAAAGDVAREMATQEQEEPLLVRAVRTTSLRYSTMKLRIEGEDDWMPDYAPVWALAALHGQGLENNWRFLRTPIYLPAHVPLKGDFTNSGADEVAANFDTPDAAQNRTHTLDFLAETL